MGARKKPDKERVKQLVINGFTNAQIKKLGGAAKIEKFCTEFLTNKLKDIENASS